MLTVMNLESLGSAYDNFHETRSDEDSMETSNNVLDGQEFLFGTYVLWNRELFSVYTID